MFPNYRVVIVSWHQSKWSQEVNLARGRPRAESSMMIGEQ